MSNLNFDPALIAAMIGSGPPYRLLTPEERALVAGQGRTRYAGMNPAYQQTVPAGAKAAEIGSIGGKTVVWNQIAPEINDSLAVGTMRTKAHAFATGTRITQGHTYYIQFNVKNKKTSYLAYIMVIAFVDGENKTCLTSSFAGADGAFGSIATAYYGGVSTGATALVDRNVWVYCVLEDQEGNSADISDVRLIDLTQHFGSGSEPQSTDDPRIAGIIAYAEEHPGYDAGSLLSAKVTEVESVGFNLWDEEWEIGSIHPDTGGNASATDRIRSKNYIPVKPNTNYYFKKMTASGSFRVFYYDIRKNFMSYYGAYSTSRVFTTPDNCYYIRFWDASAADYGDDICVNLSQPNTSITPHDGQYLPNMKDSVEIPAALRTFLSDKGYGWSAGTAYNELNLETKKYIQRVRSVDLGTLNWSYNTGNSVFLANVSALHFHAVLNNNVPFNGVSDTYPTVAKSTIWIGGEKPIGIGLDTGADWIYCNTGYSDISPTGLLYYELATPIEYDISSYLPADNLLTVEAGGTVTFVQEGGTELEVPNKVTYSVKISEVEGLVNDTYNNDLGGIYG